MKNKVKKKVLKLNNQKRLITIIITVVFAISIVQVVRILMNRNSNKTSRMISSESSEDTTPKDWEWESATKPEFGRLYFTADQNEQGIYYTNENVRKNWSSSDPGTKPYFGKFVGLDSLQTMKGFYHFLNDPKPFSHDIYVESIDQLVKGNTDEFAFGFLSWRIKENGRLENSIYKIDITNLNIDEVWTNRFTGMSGDSRGVVRIDGVIENRYLLATVYSCYDCEGEVYGKMIINVSTGSDIYLKDVTDFDVNLVANSFSFQKLFPEKEKCVFSDSAWCDDDGMVMVKKPSGQIFTQAIP